MNEQVPVPQFLPLLLLLCYHHYSFSFYSYQAPLEPLQHNLESQTYEVFERDGTKYQVYEEAIFRALKDWPTVLGHEHEPIIVMVVGAGKLRLLIFQIVHTCV